MVFGSGFGDSQRPACELAALIYPEYAESYERLTGGTVIDALEWQAENNRNDLMKVRFAEKANYWATTVHPAKSQGEIIELLEEFGAVNYQMMQGQSLP